MPVTTIVTSENISQLTLALNEFQSELVTVERSTLNPFFKKKYADLTSIMLEVQPILTKKGLAISQFPDAVDGQAALTTILTHTTGEFIRATVPLPVSKIKTVTKKEKTAQSPEKEITEEGYDPQEFGRAVTYMRRYGYSAVLQIVIDEDDDGNKSSRRHQQEERPTEVVPSNPETISKIKNIWKENGGTDEQLDTWVRKNNDDVALDALSGDRQLEMLQVLETRKEKDREAKANENLDKVAGPLPETQEGTGEKS